ncbi:MAG TPA: hypothetical protein VGQ83_34320, partial [Polyangia bacterium]
MSDLILDRLVAGELDGRPAAAHLASCLTCRRRIEELRQAQRGAESAMRAAAARLVEERRRRPGVRWRSLRVGLVGLAAAAAALLVIFGVPVHPGRRPAPIVAPSGERTKGAVALDLVVRRPDGRVELVLPGDTLAPGDAIRWRVSSDRPGFVAVVGLDQRGAVTPYYPRGAALAPVAPGRDQLLEGSIELDDAPGTERVQLVICPDARAVATVVAAGQAALARAGGNPRRVPGLDLGCAE